ncbi:MAG TPA: type VI secretion system baseplate subunit TssG [Chromatiaceae bacterium]|nr:type VI secretion system baseplate subunit TssG [Chromatiaceae bacterium]
MAGKDRTATNLVAFERELREEPWSFGFYSSLRKIECLHPEQPRIADSLHLNEDPVLFGQSPSMVFAPASIASYAAGERGPKPRLDVYLFGLFGPNGPMPLHLTEYAWERDRHHDDTALRRFCDVFHHRMLALFYRAWADAEPSVSFDRPDSDRFHSFVGALAGYGMESLTERDEMPDATKLHFAGRLAAQTKNAEGLVEIIRSYFRVPAEVEEFSGEWLTLPEEYRCRLGESPATGTLGVNVTIGASVYECQHKFTLLFGPLTLETYEKMLPGRDSLARLVAVIKNYIGDELAWDLNLLLHHDQVPETRLGEYGALGWTTWLGSYRDETPADDLVLRPCP